MRTLIPWLCGVFVGWTCGAVYIATHEDKLYQAAIDEHSKRRLAEIDRDIALGREATARAELDAVRRVWMDRQVQWWLIPGEKAERIPPQNLPVTD